jgi:hypothetical protein
LNWNFSPKSCGSSTVISTEPKRNVMAYATVGITMQGLKKRDKG